MLLCKPYCLSILHILHIIRDARPCVTSFPLPRHLLSDCSVVSPPPPPDPAGGPRSLLGSDSSITTQSFGSRPGVIQLAPYLYLGREGGHVTLGFSLRVPHNYLVALDPLAVHLTLSSLMSLTQALYGFCATSLA